MIFDKQPIKTSDWVWIYILPIGYSKIVSEKRVNHEEASLTQIPALILSLPEYRPAHRKLLLAALRVATY
jgi:hypothetical protein